MEAFKYRSKARLVAIVDLVLTIISFIVLVILFLLAIGIIIHDNKQEREVGFNDPELSTQVANLKIFAIVAWVVFVICLISLIVQFVAVKMLMNATTFGRGVAEAAKQAGFWRNYTIVFTILGVIASMRGSGSVYGTIFSWGCIMLRCLGIYVVHQFVSELQVASATSNGILPSHHGQVPMTTGIPHVYTLTLQGQDSPPNYNDVVAEVKG